MKLEVRGYNDIDRIDRMFLFRYFLAIEAITNVGMFLRATRVGSFEKLAKIALSVTIVQRTCSLLIIPGYIL